LLIKINGEPREIDDGSSLSSLVALLKLKSEQVAIELNREVVRRVEWQSTLLKDDDQVEIVHFVGGGARIH
jgi:sulfur carrier protein